MVKDFNIEFYGVKYCPKRLLRFQSFRGVVFPSLRDSFTIAQTAFHMKTRPFLDVCYSIKASGSFSSNNMVGRAGSCRVVVPVVLNTKVLAATRTPLNTARILLGKVGNKAGHCRMSAGQSLLI